ERLDPRPNRARRSVEYRGVLGQEIVRLSGGAERVELERDLGGLDIGVQLAACLRLRDLAVEEGDELPRVLGDDRAHRAVRPAVVLGLDVVEEASAAEDL